MPAKSFYGSPTKTFLEMPTTLLQVLRRTFGRLRDSRKSPGIYFGVCGSPAGLPAFTLAFAGTPASPPAFTLAFAGSPAGLPAFALAFAGTPASLPAFALTFAGTPASLPAFALTFAGVPQVLRRTCWPLQHAINDILNKGISFFCRTHAVRHRYQAM